MSIKSFLTSLPFATSAKVETPAPAVEAAPRVGGSDDFLEAYFTAPRAAVAKPAAAVGSAKLLLDSLRLADDGKVQCRVTAPDGTVMEGVIEQSFFEEFMTSPTDTIDGQRKGRIIQQNIDYLEGQADRLWREGNRELVIR